MLIIMMTLLLLLLLSATPGVFKNARDWLMTSQGLTEDQALTLLTVACDFNVHQVGWLPVGLCFETQFVTRSVCDLTPLLSHTRTFEPQAVPWACHAADQMHLVEDSAACNRGFSWTTVSDPCC